MRGRIKQKTKMKYQKRIRDVVLNGFGRPIVVHKQPVKSEWPNCYYDKLTDKSTNECKWTLAEALQKQTEYENSGGIGINYKYFVKGRCPVCRSKGYIETERKVYVECKVTWSPSSRGNDNTTTYTAAGSEGSTIVELKAHPKHFDTFKNCKNLVIDGVECRMSKAPILRGLGNQALMIITAFTTGKPKIDSGEVLKDYV